MNLLCRAKTILEPAPPIGRSTFRTLTLVASVGLLVGYGTIANAMLTSAVPIIQEQDEEEDHDVKVYKLSSDSDGEIKVVVVEDGDPIPQELVKKLKSENLGQLRDAGGNVEVVVIQNGNSKDHQGMLKKLKSDLKGQLLEIISDADDNIEAIVVREAADTIHHTLLKKLNSTHKGHILKLHADSDGDHNVFVFRDDDKEGDVKMDLHGHLVELLHGQESGKLNHQALAKKLRQLTDRLEAKHNEPHSAHPPLGKIEIHPSGEHKFHIEKRGKSGNASHQEFEFTTDEGNQIVIGKPGQTGTIVIDLKQDGGGKLHVHDGDQKKIILDGKEHGAGHHIVVEGIHLDGDRIPSDLAHKILGRIKKRIPEHKVVIEEIHKDGKHKTHRHESHASEGTSSQEGLDASIRDLKNELEELRRELKELQSDRRDRKRG